MLLTLSLVTVALSVVAVLQWRAFTKLHSEVSLLGEGVKDQERVLDRLFRNGLATGAFRFESAEATAEAERQGYDLPTPKPAPGQYL